MHEQSNCNSGFTKQQAAQLLQYLEKEQTLLTSFKTSLEQQLFRLQIEELNLLAAIRAKRVKKEEENETVKKQSDNKKRDIKIKEESTLPGKQINNKTTSKMQPTPSLEPLLLDPDLGKARTSCGNLVKSEQISPKRRKLK